MDMNPTQGQPAAKPTSEECIAKMEQAMSLMQEALAGLKGEEAGEPAEAGEDRLSVEQAFGKGFQGDRVNGPGY